MIDRFDNYVGEAIVEGNRSYTYQDLFKQISNYQAFLKNEIETNDVLIIDSDYSFNSIALLFSISMFPCIAVPIVRNSQIEFDLKADACGANKVVSFSGGDLEITVVKKEPIDYEGYRNLTKNGNSGIVLFSSGTTGKPKVMVHNLSKLINSFSPPRRQKNLRFLIFLMFDHIGGLNTTFGCLNNGSTAVIPNDRNPEDIISIIEQNQVQVLPTSPTFLNLMLQVENFEQRDLSSLRLITYGTERMPQELLNRLNERIKGVRFMQTFGTSETGILKTVSKSSNSLFFKITNDDLDYKIVDNQLLLKTKTSVQEYKDQKSDQFLKDGWFATGDLVETDEEGYIKIVGRINDVINVGGQKVLPIEVEKVINSVKGVIDSTVYAKFNAITGQMVCANVILDSKEDQNSLKQLIKQTCKEQLDKYKRPVKLNLSTEIKATSRFKKAH